MTIRLTCDTSDTKALLQDILIHTRNGHRAMFLDEPSRGAAKIQAVRVRLSRARAELKNRSRKRQYFSLHHSIHSHTENGKRFDCVVVWRTKSKTHEMLESLEDLVGHGDTL